MGFSYTFSLSFKSSKFQRISKQFEYENLGMRMQWQRSDITLFENPKKMSHLNFLAKNQQILTFFNFRAKN